MRWPCQRYCMTLVLLVEEEAVPGCSLEAVELHWL